VQGYEQRISRHNRDGAAVVDMGAYESPTKAPPNTADATSPKIKFVRTTVKESQTGRVHIRLECIEQPTAAGRSRSRRPHTTRSSSRKPAVQHPRRLQAHGGGQAARKVRSLLRHHTRNPRPRQGERDRLAGNVGHAAKRITVKARRPGA